MAVAHLITVLAAVLLWALPRHAIGGLMFGIVILPCFAAGYVVMLGLQIANTAGYTKRSLASSGIFVAYCLGKKESLFFSVSTGRTDCTVFGYNADRDFLGR